MKIGKNKQDNGRKMACMLGYFSYGTDARVQNYVNILLQQGYSVDVLCCGNENYQIQHGDAFVSVIALQDRNERAKNKFDYLWSLVRFFMRAMVKVSALHFKTKYKIIHVHNVPDFLVFTTWLPKLLGARIILDIHDVLPEFYARKFDVDMDSKVITALKIVERISCAFADHVLVANDLWRDRIIQRSVRSGKCTSFINFPDTTLFPIGPSRGPEKGNGSFTLIYHGTFSEHHGLDIAIKALSLLRDKIGPFKLVCYGGGPYEGELKSLIRTLDMEIIIDLRKTVPLQDVPKILMSADLGIVPKKDGVFVGEAISTKLFQYTAVGLPAVVSRTVAEQRYFNEDEVKFFNPGNPEDMARCIQELYENPQSRLDMAQRALKKRDVYSLSANTPKYVRIIDDLITRNRR